MTDLNGEAVLLEPAPPQPPGPAYECDLCEDRGSIIIKGKGEDACPVCSERAEADFRTR